MKYLCPRDFRRGEMEEKMDTAKIKEIISIFECSSLSSMHLEADDMKITLKKEGSAAVSAPLSISVPAPEAAAPVQEQPAAPAVQGEAVRSPLVGTFYAAPGAGAKPYVEVGSTVKEGDILCIIEAMKVMNEIHAPRAGVIKEIRAKDGDMVQFDEELMVIGD